MNVSCKSLRSNTTKSISAFTPKFSKCEKYDTTKKLFNWFYKLASKTFSVLVFTISLHWCEIPSACLVPVPNYWIWTKRTTHHNKYGNNVFFASRHQRNINATSICSCYPIKTLTSTQSYAFTGWMLLSKGNSSYFLWLLYTTFSAF